METKETEKRSFTDKWSEIIATHGHTAIPNILLLTITDLSLTNPELLTLFAILIFKWDDRNPYPSVGEISKIINRDPRTVRRHMVSMENKGLINRLPRFNDSNEYDISPLIKRLNALAEIVPPRQKRQYQKDKDDKGEMSILPSKEDLLKLDSINTNNVTNVTSSINKTYGNPEINDLLTYWELVTNLPIKTNIKANRKSASILLNMYGKDGLIQLIDGAGLALGEKFAPIIGDFCQLKDKTNQLIVWGRKKGANINIEDIS